MAQSLTFGFRDLYPNMGYGDTRSLTIPEASDQNTLVDDQKAAEQTNIQHDPTTSKSILWAVVGIVILIVLFSWR